MQGAARAAAAYLERVAVDVVRTLVPAAEQQQVGRRARSFGRLLLEPPQLLDEAQKWRQTCSWSCAAAFRFHARRAIVLHGDAVSKCICSFKRHNDGGAAANKG